MNSITNTEHTAAGLALALAVSLTLPASAGIVESYWNQPRGSLFEDPASWIGPVPDATVDAIFDLDAQYSVLFWNVDGASNRVIVRDGVVTFVLNDAGTETPRFYDALSPSFILPSVLVADAAGDATLRIRVGDLECRHAIIGLVPGSVGTVSFVTAAGLAPALIAQDHIHVGLQGTGVLDVANAAQASCTDAVVGSLAGGSGEVSVSGGGSTLDCSGKLTVGKQGEGTLEISDDGAVGCASAIVGQQTGGVGGVTVTGVGSTLDIAGTIDVGMYGQGTLSVLDGGAVLSAGFATIGTFGPSFGSDDEGTGVVTVAGPVSAWLHDGDISVGFQGAGELHVIEGAAVTSDNGSVGTANLDGEIIGVGLGVVDGPGSAWGLSGLLSVHTALTVSGGALVIADTIAVVSGELDGDGTLIGFVVNDGTVAPGHPLGTLTVQGNFTQDANQLLIELGGTVPESFDSLAVTQTAQIGGSVIVSLADGFVPSAGDSFTIVSAGTLLGAFETMTLPDLGPSLTWQVTQDASALVLQAIGSGDLDGDGSVGITDFLSLLKAWGACPPKGDCPADLDGDGEVSITDFLLLLNAWD